MALPLIPLILVGSGAYTMLKAWAKGHAAAGVQQADFLFTNDLAIPLLPSSVKTPPAVRLPTTPTAQGYNDARLHPIKFPTVTKKLVSNTHHVRGFGFLGPWGR